MTPRKVAIRQSLDFLLTFAVFGNAKLLRAIRQVEGLSSYVENEFLFRCAREGFGKGLIVEIGCYKGRSTIALASGSKSRNREKVYVVDPLREGSWREEFLKNIREAGLEDYVIADFRRSEEAVKDFKGAVRLLFIDGSHEYKDVSGDILFWKEFLIEGGLIILHDYFPKGHRYYIEGVHRATEELIEHSPDFIPEGWLDSTFFASKKVSQRPGFFESFNAYNKVSVFVKSLLDLSFLKTAD
jgi:predicted O-methyltransferase YrrM